MAIASGNATIVDVNATHVNAQYGERPGFDPRMNDFPYTVTFLSGAANGQTLDANGGVIDATATIGDGFNGTPSSSRSMFAAGAGIVHRF